MYSFPHSLPLKINRQSMSWLEWVVSMCLFVSVCELIHSSNRNGKSNNSIIIIQLSSVEASSSVSYSSSSNSNSVDSHHQSTYKSDLALATLNTKFASLQRLVIHVTLRVENNVNNYLNDSIIWAIIQHSNRDDNQRHSYITDHSLDRSNRVVCLIVQISHHDYFHWLAVHLTH